MAKQSGLTCPITRANQAPRSGSKNTYIFKCQKAKGETCCDRIDFFLDFFVDCIFLEILISSKILELIRISFFLISLLISFFF